MISAINYFLMQEVLSVNINYGVKFAILVSGRLWISVMLGGWCLMFGISLRVSTV